MIWTGQELYNLYAQRTLELQNCGMDPWEELTKEDQDVWSALANDVSNND